MSILLLISCGHINQLYKFDKEKWRYGSQVLELIVNPKDSINANFHYLVDFGYMTPFHLDINFYRKNNKVIKVTLAD